MKRKGEKARAACERTCGYGCQRNWRRTGEAPALLTRRAAIAEARMDQPGKLILVRHGESESNLARSFSASPDIELTASGVQQAYEAARRIKVRFTPEAVVSSHFRRARQTAEIIGAELNLPVEIVDEIHERDLGALRGHSYDMLRALVKEAPDYDPSQGWLWRPPQRRELRGRTDARDGGV